VFLEYIHSCSTLYRHSSDDHFNQTARPERHSSLCHYQSVSTPDSYVGDPILTTVFAAFFSPAEQVSYFTLKQTMIATLHFLSNSPFTSLYRSMLYNLRNWVSQGTETKNTSVTNSGRRLTTLMEGFGIPQSLQGNAGTVPQSMPRSLTPISTIRIPSLNAMQSTQLTRVIK
jgi:hypothetical protein